MQYQRWRFRLPEELEDLFAAELHAHGSTGLEVRPAPPAAVRIDAYFPEPPPAALAALDLEPWRARGAELMARETLAARDWLATYREHARPIAIGRFVVDPRDPETASTSEDGVEPDDGRIRLRIPAQSAFGTGSHESTRLALEWLERLDLAGLDVLDVGTGSGILAFAALALGARRVVALDLDPEAVVIARRNARRNGFAPELVAGRLATLRPRPGFDLALVNVLPGRVAGDLPFLAALLRPGARLVSSGNLADERDALLRRFGRLGLRCAGELAENEWTAFLLERA